MNRAACHPMAADSNARLKRRTVLGILRGAQAMGRGDGWVTADCVLCGLTARRDVPADAPDALEVGHVLADNAGGCGNIHNLVPMCYACNRALRDTHAETFVWVYDPRGVTTLPVPRDDPGAGSAPARDRAPGSADGRGMLAWERVGV